MTSYEGATTQDPTKESTTVTETSSSITPSSTTSTSTTPSSTTSSSTTPSSTTPSSADYINAALNRKSCGYKGPICGDDQSCYIIPPRNLTCQNSSNSSSPSWKLNATTFPPIEYAGPLFADSVGKQCEILPSIEGEAGEFVKCYYNLLMNIGSCLDDFQSTRLYCNASTQTCYNKLDSGAECVSSNQCKSEECTGSNLGSDLELLDIQDSNVTTTCVNSPSSSSSAFSILTGNGRKPNASYKQTFPDEKSVNTSGSNNGDGSTTNNGQVAVIAACVLIMVISVMLIIYARRIFKRQMLEDLETTGLEIDDNHNGEHGNNNGTVPISSMGLRIRRGASILLNHDSIRRSNSITTLPPYQTVEEQPSPSIMTSITNWLMPPGELPPPYEAIDSSHRDSHHHVSNNNTDNINNGNDDRTPSVFVDDNALTHETELTAPSIQEVRQGVMFIERAASPALSVTPSQHSTLSGISVFLSPPQSPPFPPPDVLILGGEEDKFDGENGNVGNDAGVNDELIAPSKHGSSDSNASSNEEEYGETVGLNS
ncbi:8700_t:CDS:2 [Ambispora leptoticha]|uniref:8700_t:CDS:1 n=1 Tax=Ambispora leptoticha TaxID=144679 RepID=A0A9N9FRY3_9GLOM|nr:8700_t:CDS:2 [Ambispora leptoticha]